MAEANHRRIVLFDKIKRRLPFKRGDESARRVAAHSAQHPLTRLEQDLSQLLGQVFSLRSTFFGLPPTRDAGSWFDDFSTATFSPSLDLADQRKHFEATLELPGIDPEDVEIEMPSGAPPAL